MRTPLVVRRYPAGPRVWVCGHRLHHGLVGLLLVSTRRRHLVAAGLVLLAHDRADWRDWCRHEGLTR